MVEELEKKLEELKALIKKDATYQEAKHLKEKLMGENTLLEQIRQLQDNPNTHSEEYKNQKENLYTNQDYQKYQNLENELYFLTLEINQRLNQLTEKGVCQNENH